MKERTVERSQPLSPVVGKVSFATQNRHRRYAAAVGNVVPDALQSRGTSKARLNVEIARHTDGDAAFVHTLALAGRPITMSPVRKPNTLFFRLRQACWKPNRWRRVLQSEHGPVQVTRRIGKWVPCPHRQRPAHTS